MLAYCNIIKILYFYAPTEKMAKFTGNAKKDQKMCLGIWIYSVWALLKKETTTFAHCAIQFVLDIFFLLLYQGRRCV